MLLKKRTFLMHQVVQLSLHFPGNLPRFQTYHPRIRVCHSAAQCTEKGKKAPHTVCMSGKANPIIPSQSKVLNWNFINGNVGTGYLCLFFFL